jgi:hypothetical protein
MTRSKNVRFALALASLPILMTSMSAVGVAHDAASSDKAYDFCGTVVKIQSTLSSSIPLEAMPPKSAQQAAGYQLSVVEPLFAAARQAAPKDVSAAFDQVATATIQALTTLDFAATQTADFAKADDAVDAKLLADCKFQNMQVTASNYEYTGLTEVLAPGATALTLTNKGDEVHEISIARINDGVNLSAKEILSLPMKESLAAITLMSYAQVPPGGSETTFLNLASGRYYAVCFTPRGTMAQHAPGKGTPHLMLGMLKEFSIQ